MEKILRVALYVRVSTEEQAMHGYSLIAQEEELIRFAAENRMKVVGIYRDEGNSARKPAMKRKVMLELLEDVKAGQIDRILFIKLDRWFRNVREYHRVQAILDDHGVTWQATMEDYSTATADGRFKVNIMLSVAENEADRTSERIKFVFEAKRRRKELCFGGNAVPFGYMSQRIDGIRRLVKNPETEPIVEDFWNHFRKYNSVRLAALFVNEKYQIKRSYKTWMDVARNEIYTGVHRGIEDFCPAYIEHKEWEQLREPKKNIKMTQDPNRVYLFTGILFCPSCGKRLRGTFCQHKNAAGETVEYRSYRCNDKVLGLCSFTNQISESIIERYLLKNVRKELEEYIVKSELQGATQKKKTPEVDITKLTEKLRRLNTVYMAGNIDDDEYTKLTRELKAKIEKARQAEKDERPPDLEVLKQLLKTDFEAIYHTLEPEDKRRLWRSVISEIHLEGNKVKSITPRA